MILKKVVSTVIIVCLLLTLLFNVSALSEKTTEDFFPAFPGAEGYGAKTAGGRSFANPEYPNQKAVVLHVTNLNDSGSGSFRDCVTRDLPNNAPRYVVFDVGGTIQLESSIIITKPFITIAGQTAPGDGICFIKWDLGVQTHDVIIRGIRVRPGDASGPSSDNVATFNGPDGIKIQGKNKPEWDDVYNIIYDHCSISWSMDENISLWYSPLSDITIQYCISSEGLSNSYHKENYQLQSHSMGVIVGPNTRKLSLHHNIFATNNNRNPRIAEGTEVELINNVIYNWGADGTQIASSGPEPSITNIINNYYKGGPETGKNNMGMTIYMLAEGSRVYASGNVGPGEYENISDQWNLVTGTVQYRTYLPAVVPSGITTQSAKSAYETVLNNAGCIAPKRDFTDERIIKDITNGTGNKVDYQLNEKGEKGYPIYVDGEKLLDTDDDGIPDEWEKKKGLNPNVLDSTELAPSGYMWIEEYANSLIPMSAYSSEDAVVYANDPVEYKGLTSQNVYINVDKEKQEHFDKAVIIGGRTMVSPFELFEKLGAVVQWNTGSNTISISKKNRSVQVFLKEEYAIVDGDKRVLDVSAKIVNGRPMVPLRFVCEALELAVEWDEKSRTVNISTDDWALSDELPSGFPYDILPTDDVYVRDGNNADNNYAKESTVVVKEGGDGYKRLGYMKFDLSSLSAESLLMARVKLFVNDLQGGGPVTVKIYAVEDDNWNENEITWNTKKDFGKKIAEVNIKEENTGIIIDVTEYMLEQIQKDKTATIGIMGSVEENLSATFNSKERDNASLLEIVSTIEIPSLAPMPVVEEVPEITAHANVNLKDTTVIQAEDTTIKLGGFEKQHQGFTGIGYVNYNNVVGSSIEWTVKALDKGSYYLTLVYANGGTDDRPMDIQVNGQTLHSSVKFPSNGGWTGWNPLGMWIDLEAGYNIIRAVAISEGGGPNVDMVIMSADEKAAAEVFIPVIEPTPIPTPVPTPTPPLVPPTGDAAEDIYYIEALADTYIRGGEHMDLSFGADAIIDIKEGPDDKYKRHAYYKFDLSSLSSNECSSAVFTVNVNKLQKGGPCTAVVYGIENDNWEEADLTWSNAPKLGEKIADAVFAAEGKAEIDLTDYVNSQLAGDKIVSFCIKGILEENLTITLDSKEGVAKPSLEVVTKKPVPVSGAYYIEPASDTYVQGGDNMDVNFGVVKLLEIKEGAEDKYKRHAYYQFDLSSLSQKECSSAIFTVNVIDLQKGGPCTVLLYSVEDDNWEETALTWNTKPAVGEELVSFVLTDKGKADIDITDYINQELAGDKLASFCIKGLREENLTIKLDTKEGSVKPMLEVSMGQLSK